MWFNVFVLGLVLAQRLAELAISRRNARRMLKFGGTEIGEGYYVLLIAVQALWILGLIYFTLGIEASWPWLGAYMAVQAARGWVIAAAGNAWTSRLITMPPDSPIDSGVTPYLRYPHHVAVAAEVFILPMVWGLFWYAMVFTIALAAVITWRIRVEEQALRAARPA